MFNINDRVRLVKALSYHDGGAGGTIDIELPAGAIGTVTPDWGTDLKEMLNVRFDERFACLDEWDNCVTLYCADDSNGLGIGDARELLAAA